jgi:hypothetical protein
MNSMAASEQDSTTSLTAIYMGKTVIQTTEPLVLRSSWNVTGTRDKALFTDFLWELNGQIVSTSFELVISLPKPGDYFFHLSYRDEQGNRYATIINVRVMEPAEYDTMVAAVQAAANLPLWLEDEEIFLPIVSKNP